MNSATRKVITWSITVALGGFLFGFDTAVISGAEQSIQKLWQLTDVTHGLAVAMALYGTVVGAMFGGVPADILGRKMTLFWIALLYLVSAVGSALAPDPYTFMILRFLGGLGVGASSVVAPMYISEISPASKRGRLVMLFQFNIVLGILIAYVSNYLLADFGATNWRWMLGVEAVPAFFFLIMVLKVPESPRWLILKKNDTKTAFETLNTIDPGQAKEEVKLIQSTRENGSTEASTFKSFFSGRFNYPIMLAFLFAFFNQVSGINAIIYYAPRIFELTGAAKSSSLLSTAGIGLINMIFTMAGMFIIDRFGRKTLMYIGSFGLMITLGLVSNAFYNETFDGVPLYLFAYIAFFAMSQGAVIWVFISEIFPNSVRGIGQSFGCFTHWLLAAIIANAFPFFVNTFSGGPIFAFFSVMMFLQLLYVWKIMPETKGKSLEELEMTMDKEYHGMVPENKNSEQEVFIEKTVS